jgi:DNA-binding transcriptional MerR regulator
MTAAAAPERERPLRIGEVAELTGTTPRTIRYYEEVGLLPARDSSEKGTHRTYDEGDVETLGSLVRLRELLGLSLDDLRTMVSAESARAGLRREFEASAERPDERARILYEARTHVETQLALLRARRKTIAQLEGELTERLDRIAERLDECGAA